MKSHASKLYKKLSVSLILIIFSLFFSIEAYAERIYYDGVSDQFRVTVTWEVLNDHQDVGNGFGVYYYKPYNGGYYKADTGQYSFVKSIYNLAKEKGTRSYTMDLQGPPCRIYMQVYGSAMDNTQFYLKKVEVEPLHPRPGTGLPTKFTLWEGEFGCSVATMFTNTIACDLFLDRGKPEFSGWYDPYTRKEAVFGDDKINKTNDYYDHGCYSPYIYGHDSDGNLYDQYGVAWPDYYPPKYTSKAGGKVVIDWKNYRKYIKNILPKAKYVEVQYGTDAKFKKATIKRIKIKDLKNKTVINKLKEKKNYYFRVRLSDGKKATSNWSSIIKIKTK